MQGKEKWVLGNAELLDPAFSEAHKSEFFRNRDRQILYSLSQFESWRCYLEPKLSYPAQ